MVNKFEFKALNNNPGPGKYDVIFKRNKKNWDKSKWTFGITYNEKKCVIFLFIMH